MINYQLWDSCWTAVTDRAFNIMTRNAYYRITGDFLEILGILLQQIFKYRAKSIDILFPQVEYPELIFRTERFVFVLEVISNTTAF